MIGSAIYFLFTLRMRMRMRMRMIEYELGFILRRPGVTRNNSSTQHFNGLMCILSLKFRLLFSELSQPLFSSFYEMQMITKFRKN